MLLCFRYNRAEQLSLVKSQMVCLILIWKHLKKMVTLKRYGIALDTNLDFQSPNLPFISSQNFFIS